MEDKDYVKTARELNESMKEFTAKFEKDRKAFEAQLTRVDPHYRELITQSLNVSHSSDMLAAATLGTVVNGLLLDLIGAQDELAEKMNKIVSFIDSQIDPSKH